MNFFLCLVSLLTLNLQVVVSRPIPDSPSVPCAEHQRHHHNKSHKPPSGVPTPYGSSSAPAPAAPKAAAPVNVNADQAAYLTPHNDLRSRKGAVALTWSDSLASTAQAWANRCVFEHSQGDTGENLSAGTGDFDAAAGVKLWTDEESEYDPSNPQYSHYTQVVWKGSTEVGCAVATCNDLLGAGTGPGFFHVCEYNPPGNVIGEFPENVEA